MKTPILKMIGGMLIVASGLIGAGILALPASIGVSGFYSSTIALLMGYLFMLYALFLLLEVNLWFPEKSNLIKMCQELLGNTAKNIIWVFYLLLLYALLVAYIVGITPLLMTALNYFSISISPAYISIAFVITLGAFIYYGTRSVDYANRYLTISLIILFFFLVGVLLPHSDSDLLAVNNFQYVWVSTPIIVTAFLIHFVVPSLRDYLHSDSKALIWVFSLGLLIAFILYSLWILAITGVVNFTELVDIANSSTPTIKLVMLLEANTNNSWIGTLATLFSAAAIITSFLGVSLGLAHFVTDGLRVEGNIRNHYLVVALTFIPPLTIALLFPNTFLSVLRYAGVITVIIFILFPTIMLWKGRYIDKRPSNFRVIGGKFSLIMVGIIALAIFYSEVANIFHWLPSVTH